MGGPHGRSASEAGRAGVGRQEARQTGFLQEAKSKLEKQCEDLTWRLQYEKRLRVRVGPPMLPSHAPFWSSPHFRRPSCRQVDAEEAKVAEVGRLQAVVEHLHAQAAEVQALLATEKQERERERVRLSELQLQPQVERRLNVDAAHELSELRAEVKELEAQNQQLRALLDRSDTRAAEAESKVEESESVMGMYEEAQTDLRETREELERSVSPSPHPPHPPLCTTHSTPLSVLVSERRRG